MTAQPTRTYTIIVGVFLLIQGTSTLAFRLLPQLDQAFPLLLSLTQMRPTHSVLHIITGLIAILTVYGFGKSGSFWFATGFGIAYTTLAIIGSITHRPSSLYLQPFDHPFHFVVGVIGLITATIQYRRHQFTTML